MFMTCKDKLPAPPRRHVWRDGEQRAVIGKCLQTVFAAEANTEMVAVLASLPGGNKFGRNPG